ncbi:MAG: DUF4350 domain-containing protein [Stackebrandtia sp.]
MTTTEVAPRAAKPPAKRPRLNRRRLWTPIAVALAIIVLTMIAAFIRSPSPGAESFLSPQSSGGDGSAKLAASLEDEGVPVKRYTDAVEAFDEAENGDTTVFIPAPDYLNSQDMEQLQSAASASPIRFVFVDPSRDFLDALGLRKEGSARIAPKTVEPPGRDGKCSLPAASDAGAASMLRQQYAKTDSSAQFTQEIDWRFCYDNGLAFTRTAESSLVVAGASDPFTDEYFDEAGNAELTTGLLGRHKSVVWLDKHSLSTLPDPSDPASDPPSAEEPPPTTESRDPIEYPGEARTSPIYDALPTWLWAALVGTVVLGVLAALWKGRRLGPPVTEPLPVTVPAAETVHGRARLYRRAHAYAVTLRALRAGALHRIQPALGLSSQATDAEVVEAVANRTGWPSEQVTATLYGAQPANEDQLFDATQAVDALVSAVENASPKGEKPSE